MNKTSIMLFSLMIGQMDPLEALAKIDLPSAVKSDDPRILSAYKYIFNVEDASKFGMSNVEYAKVLLGLTKSQKVDKSLIVKKGSPISLISPVYAALVSRLGSPLTEEHISKGVQLGNRFMGDLIRGINLIPSGKGDHFRAREYFLKNIIEIANLGNNEYAGMSGIAKQNLNPNNILTEFPKLNATIKSNILNKIFEPIVLTKPLPMHVLNGKDLNESALKDPGLNLKNFYYSLGFYAVAEDFVLNGEGSVSWKYRIRTNLYGKLYERFKYHTAQQPILYGPRDN
ncbi:MAG: hypothetical protein V3575_05525 [Candidatus Absconditabacteria bacterium]